MTDLPFTDLRAQYKALRPDILERIERVLDHGRYILGPEVEELEQALASFTGADQCVTVASGTEALLIALMALGIGAGDEVITTPFSFIATAEVIALIGAIPRFVDVEIDTANIDVSLVEERITARTRAIMPVSLYGQPADMDTLNRIGENHGLVVVEDAAQSLGAEYAGRKSGHLSAIGCTSFFPSKPLGCYGDGGAIFTDNAALAAAFREIRAHGQSRRYHHTRVGVGGRMDTLQCAILLAKLKRFEWEVAERQAKAARYDQAFDSAGIERVRVRPDRTSAVAQYTVMIEERDRVAAALAGQGIPTAVHYPVPMNIQPAYCHFDEGHETPVAARLSQRVLSLPISADIEESDQDRVAEALIAAAKA